LNRLDQDRNDAAVARLAALDSISLNGTRTNPV
jgi:hypothetical protein